MKLNIKKEDTVMVISGDDKGKTGRVIDVDKEKMKVLVEGINIHVKHERPSQQNQDGGRVEKEFPVPYSNVMLVDKNGEQTRVGIRHEEDKNGKIRKVRVAKTTGEDLD